MSPLDAGEPPAASSRRAAAALRLIQNLTSEQHRLMAHYWHVPLHERPAVQQRLQQIARDLAAAHAERRRARAGAPPAPRVATPPVDLPRSASDEHEPLQRRRWRHTAEAVRADYRQGQGLSSADLARKYNLSPRQVERALRDQTGQGHSTARLNAAQVRDILQRYAESNGRRGIITELAAHYQVGRNTISDIVSRRTWRTIDSEQPALRKRPAGKRRRTGRSPGAR